MKFLTALFAFIFLTSFIFIDREPLFITVLQHGNEMPVQDGQTIEVKRDTFSIRFPCGRYTEKKFYNVKLVAVLDRNLIENIKPGVATSSLACFEMGSGMACDSTGFYESLFFNNEGHHYLFYSGEEDRRTKLISREGKSLRLEYTIKSFWLDKKIYPFKDFPFNEFYLALFFDNNLNERIDTGELVKLTVKLVSG